MNFNQQVQHGEVLRHEIEEDDLSFQLLRPSRASLLKSDEEKGSSLFLIKPRTKMTQSVIFNRPLKIKCEEDERSKSVDDDLTSKSSTISQNYKKSAQIESNRKRVNTLKKSIKQLIRRSSNKRSQSIDEIPLKPQIIKQKSSSASKFEIILESIQQDSVMQLKNYTTQELLELRFEYNMNLLQLICHEEAVNILKHLVILLKRQKNLKQQMIEHRENHIGSKAIHLAASTGNKQVIDILISEFKADVNELTSNQQTVLHCAAQRYEGVAAIFSFASYYKIDVAQQDSKGATALHFACLSVNIKNVQALIKIGADPNSMDNEGNTPMHLCLELLFDDPESFEQVKNVIKELIFSGGSRDIKNKLGQTPIDILQELVSVIEQDQFKKMQYILTPPKGNRYLRMTRPIEKVQRGAGCQISALLFNLIILGVFVFGEVYDYMKTKKGTQHYVQLIIFCIAAFFFFLTLLFYAMTMINPGYVTKQPKFQQLLDKLIEENYHLDYVCIPCETLRPENAEHCNFCNRCVQKFDHHCVFVNNCLGYRNHKWFLLFLLSFTTYMVFILTHAIFEIIKIYRSKVVLSDKDYVIVINFSMELFLISVVLIHAPIVILQLISQIGKLFKIIDEFDENLTTSNDENSKAFRQVERSSFWRNLVKIFCFKPQSQEYLYKQLFGEEHSYIQSLEVVDEEDEQIIQSPGQTNNRRATEQIKNLISPIENESGNLNLYFQSVIEESNAMMSTNDDYKQLTHFATQGKFKVNDSVIDSEIQSMPLEMSQQFS